MDKKQIILDFWEWKDIYSEYSMLPSSEHLKMKEIDEYISQLQEPKGWRGGIKGDFTGNNNRLSEPNTYDVEFWEQNNTFEA